MLLTSFRNLNELIKPLCLSVSVVKVRVKDEKCNIATKKVRKFFRL